MFHYQNRRGLVGAMAAAMLTGAVVGGGAAQAGACDDARNGLTLIHFERDRTDIPEGFRQKLDRFASVARHRSAICVFGSVDAQPKGDSLGRHYAHGRQIARSRALNIKLYLTSRGVPEKAIEVVTQDLSFTLFGTLDPNQPANRRVRLTHD